MIMKILSIFKIFITLTYKLICYNESVDKGGNCIEVERLKK